MLTELNGEIALDLRNVHEVRIDWGRENHRVVVLLNLNARHEVSSAVREFCFKDKDGARAFYRKAIAAVNADHERRSPADQWMSEFTGITL